MPTCAKLHSPVMCSIDWYCWVRDIQEPARAEEDYSDEYETEVDARDRLGETTAGDQSFGPDSRPDPTSSFGPYYP